MPLHHLHHTHTHSLSYETCACIWTYGNSEMIHPTNRPTPNNRRCHAKFETRSVCAIQPPHRHTHHNIHYNREIVLRMPDTNLHIDYGCFHTKPFSTSGDLWTLKAYTKNVQRTGRVGNGPLPVIPECSAVFEFKRNIIVVFLVVAVHIPCQVWSTCDRGPACVLVYVCVSALLWKFIAIHQIELEGNDTRNYSYTASPFPPMLGRLRRSATEYGPQRRCHSRSYLFVGNFFENGQIPMQFATLANNVVLRR